jgi:putative transposase
MRTDYHSKLEENVFYHVYNRANGRDRLFVEKENYDFFLQRWKLLLSKYVDTYAYCLIGNHFHFIIRIKPVDDQFKNSALLENTVAARKFLAGTISVNTFLEDQFKRFFNSYAAAFNIQQNRHGSVFQKRFKRIRLRSETHIVNKICYVHHNPIHHNMAYFYEAWQYSSYLAYTTLKPTSIERTMGLMLFDSINEHDLKVKAFIDYHEAYKKNFSGAEHEEWEDPDDFPTSPTSPTS